MRSELKTKTILAVLILISIFCRKLSAIDEWQKTAYAPHVMIGFRPIDEDPLSNVLMNYTMKNAVNGFIGWTFEKSDLDNYEVGRFMNMGLQMIVDDWVDDYTHETSHVWKLESLGAGNVKMHFRFFDRSYVTYRGGLNSLDEMIEGWAAGHNIDTEIGRHAIERIYLSEVSTNTDHLDYLNSNISQLIYILNNNGKTDDYRSYIDLFNQREGHHEISLGRFQTFSTLIFLSNLNIYGSGSNVWDYIDTGRKYSESPYNLVTNNLELGKPDISQYLLKNGVMCTISEYGLYKSNPFRISFSHDLDGIVGGHLSTMILGAEVFDFIKYEDISSSLMIDTVFDEKYIPTGFSIGTNGKYRTGPLSSIFWRLSYSIDHPVETYFNRDHWYGMIGAELTW